MLDERGIFMCRRDELLGCLVDDGAAYAVTRWPCDPGAELIALEVHYRTLLWPLTMRVPAGDETRKGEAKQ